MCARVSIGWPAISLVIVSPFELFCTVITPSSSTGRPQEEEDRPQEGKSIVTSIIQFVLSDGRAEGGLFTINQFLMCLSIIQISSHT